MENDALLTEMRQAIIEGDRGRAEALAREAVSSGMDLNVAIEQGFVPGIQEVGDLWDRGEYFLPELITSAECMKSAMDILQPELARVDQRARSLGKVVIGTIEGDIHDIGKNLVAAMLRANGFDVTDLGADVNLDRFVSSAREQEADLICVSALLTTTMLKQKTLVMDLKESGLQDRVKIMVGGAPVNRRWADEIGANGYASDAMSAVEAAKKLMEAR